MKQYIILAAAALSVSAWAQVWVAPHVRNDGTFVPGYVRSAPDSTVDNNYGTRGNVNPYTGQTGTQPRSYEQPQTYQAPAGSIYAPAAPAGMYQLPQTPRY